MIDRKWNKQENKQAKKERKKESKTHESSYLHAGDTLKSTGRNLWNVPSQVFLLQPGKLSGRQSQLIAWLCHLGFLLCSPFFLHVHRHLLKLYPLKINADQETTDVKTMTISRRVKLYTGFFFLFLRWTLLIRTKPRRKKNKRIMVEVATLLFI